MSSITHYDGCWQDERHHACAVREIERLRDERDAYSNEITGKLMPEIERLRSLLQQAISARWPPPPEWYEAAQRVLGNQ